MTQKKMISVLIAIASLAMFYASPVRAAQFTTGGNYIFSVGGFSATSTDKTGAQALGSLDSQAFPGSTLSTCNGPADPSGFKNTCSAGAYTSISGWVSAGANSWTTTMNVARSCTNYKCDGTFKDTTSEPDSDSATKEFTSCPSGYYYYTSTDTCAYYTPSVSAQSVPADANEGITYTATVVVSDQDVANFGETITWAPSGIPAGLTFTGESSGALRGTITGKFQSNESATSYAVKIDAKDSKNRAADKAYEFTIKVNRPPKISGAPTSKLLAIANNAFSFTPTFSDPNNDQLFFSFSPQISWLSINSQGVLAGTPEPKDIGLYSGVIITVCDRASNGLCASLPPFDISVAVRPIADAGGPYSAKTGETLSLDGTLSSAFSASAALVYTWTIGGSTVVGSAFQPYDVNLSAGDYDIQLVVNDGVLDSDPSLTRLRVVGYETGLNVGRGTDCNGSNPINGATGNKYQLETDYVGVGPFPLVVQRHYNSIGAIKAWLGANWRGHYDRSVVLDLTRTPNVARAYREDGSFITYQLVGGIWQAPPVVTDRLIQNGTSGWTLSRSDDTVENYNAAGQVIQIVLRGGLSQTISYISGQIDTVTDSFGRSLKYAYSNGRVFTITLKASTYTDTLLVTYSYDGNGNLEFAKYPGSLIETFRQYHYKVDPKFKHLLEGITDENSKRFAIYGYDANGYATSSEHAGGVNKVRFDFTANTTGTGSTVITDAKNQGRTFSYINKNGKLGLSSITGPACNVCGGLSANNAYDANGFLDTVTDFNGVVTDYTFNARGLEDSRTEALSTPNARTILTFWHATYRVPTCIIEPQRSIKLDYFSSGLLQSRTEIDTSTLSAAADKTCATVAGNAALKKRSWSYTYYASGLLETVNGPRIDVTDVTTYFYYADGNLKEIRNPLYPAFPATVYSEYDIHGRPHRIVDGNGLVTKLTYDLRGRPDTVSVGTDAGGFEITDYDFNPAGTLAKVTLPTGAFLRYAYDDAQRLTDIYDHLGNLTHYGLDALGNIERREIREGATFGNPASGTLQRVQTAVFNSNNRLEQLIGAGVPAQITKFINPVGNAEGYDANGNLQHVQDPQGRHTAYTYDKLARLETITDAKNGVTTYTYDANNRIRTVTDPNSTAPGNHVTTYDYDGLGNLTKLTSPDTGITNYTLYDDAGNLKSITDARGKITLYQYDAINRIDLVTYNDSTTADYIYDVVNGSGASAFGRLTSIVDASGTVKYEYDLIGRVRKKTQTVGSVTLAMDYIYDAQGKLDKIKYPSGKELKFDYASALVSALSIVGGDSLMKAMSYEPFGSVRAWTWGNNAVVNQHYNLDGQMDRFSMPGSRRDLTYYPAGNVETIKNPSNAAVDQTLNYDELYRLNSQTGPVGAFGFGYDANGNRTTYTVGTQSRTNVVSPTSNRYSTVNLVSYGYDNAGNLASDGTFNYSYDDRGRLAGITKTSNGTTVATYSINALGQRVKKVMLQAVGIQPGDANGDLAINATDFSVASDAVAGKAAATGNADCNQDARLTVQDLVCINSVIKNGTARTTLYVYDESGQLRGEYDASGNAVREYVWFEGKPVAMLAGGRTYFVYSDQLNTPRAVVDRNNTTVWSWDASEAFGNSAPNDDPDNDKVRMAFNLRFPGQYFDVESGLHFNYFRTYDPKTGRYLESDPIGLGGGLNTYAYGNSNPARWIDIRGLSATTADDVWPGNSPWDDIKRGVGLGIRGLGGAIATICVSLGGDTPQQGNRGRIQAQGAGYEDSEAWAQPKPLSLAEGLAKLEALVTRMPNRIYKARDIAIARARAWMTRASLGGGIGRTSQTFQNPGARDERIDIEVWTGMAFVP